LSTDAITDGLNVDLSFMAVSFMQFVSMTLRQTHIFHKVV